MVSFQTRFEQIGEERGEQRGKANLLLDLLETRFGAIPEELRTRIAQADVATLSHWSRRLLTADSIDAVLR